MAKWEQIGNEKIFSHPRIELSEDTVKLPSDAETKYLRIDSIADFPTVIPVLEDGRFIMTEEHAYPYNDDLLQFPEGLCNKDESVEDAARREFQEETGYSAKNLRLIGKPLHNHRRSSARNVVFIASNLTKDESLIQRDAEEHGMQIRTLTEAEIWKGISEGKIIQKNTIAAWGLYHAYKRQEP